VARRLFADGDHHNDFVISRRKAKEAAKPAGIEPFQVGYEEHIACVRKSNDCGGIAWSEHLPEKIEYGQKQAGTSGTGPGLLRLGAEGSPPQPIPDH
jgi:hypothetical protein